MLCSDLKVVSLNITEDNYEYKALFRLCTDYACMDIDLGMLSDAEVLEQIKSNFSIDEPVAEMEAIIMDKVMEASSIESRVSEGEKCCGDIKDEKIRRSVDSLSVS